MDDRLATYLKTRRTIPASQLGEPGPDPATLREMLTIAARVPDHGKLAPWRFILFDGRRARRRSPGWSKSPSGIRTRRSGRSGPTRRRASPMRRSSSASSPRRSPTIRRSRSGSSSSPPARVVPQPAPRRRRLRLLGAMADRLVRLRRGGEGLARPEGRASRSPASSTSARRPCRRPSATGRMSTKLTTEWAAAVVALEPVALRGPREQPLRRLQVRAVEHLAVERGDAGAAGLGEGGDDLARRARSPRRRREGVVDDLAPGPGGWRACRKSRRAPPLRIRASARRGRGSRCRPCRWRRRPRRRRRRGRGCGPAGTAPSSRRRRGSRARRCRRRDPPRPRSGRRDARSRPRRCRGRRSRRRISVAIGDDARRCRRRCRAAPRARESRASRSATSAPPAAFGSTMPSGAPVMTTSRSPSASGVESALMRT